MFAKVVVCIYGIIIIYMLVIVSVLDLCHCLHVTVGMLSVTDSNTYRLTLQWLILCLKDTLSGCYITLEISLHRA